MCICVYALMDMNILYNIRFSVHTHPRLRHGCCLNTNAAAVGGLPAHVLVVFGGDVDADAWLLFLAARRNQGPSTWRIVCVDSWSEGDAVDGVWKDVDSKLAGVCGGGCRCFSLSGLLLQTAGRPSSERKCIRVHPCTSEDHVRKLASKVM
jgi:hypothetical protein